MIGKIIISKNVSVAMRDGISLRTDIYQLEDMKPSPTLLQRLPYNKDESNIVGNIVDPLRAVQDGYVVVIQDSRGRFSSKGEFKPFHSEAKDGYDTVEWIAQQPWSNGNVGMYGVSYVGALQWLAVSEKPPHLKALVPVATSLDFYHGWVYNGGAFELGFSLLWTLGLAPNYLTKSSECSEEAIDTVICATEQIEELYKTRPLKNLQMMKEINWYDEWLSHPQYDEYWKKLYEPLKKSIDLPIYHIGGWYDVFIRGTLDGYNRFSKKTEDFTNSRNKLLIGPWAHSPLWGVYPEKDFGSKSSATSIDLCGKIIEFFDCYLKGDSELLLNKPSVEIFDMGAGAWKYSTQWPLPKTTYIPFYFHSQGQANTLEGDGKLSRVKPVVEREDTYLFDPNNPVPTIGGQTFLPGAKVPTNAGPRDQRVVEQRHDVLCYTTEVLESSLEVIGAVKAIIYASSSAKDTDFTVKLVDVHPDQRAFILTEGIIRGRYRNSFEKEKLLVPNQTYEFQIDVGATANLFKAGHQIRVEISSSNFPKFDANTNTGGVIAEEQNSDTIVAKNCIFHNQQFPSRIILPIINET
ncbi:CocE/NonD family hydrolase [Bacillus solitudinis]|uniref:CocE/NonD family hydrolase n=1 Tax=Bacillus solitudinis TaxID=2014074 RepID=UPI000C24BF4A|nr:CocE/NonD family hydrolase [Bacillus solitudinis]